MFKKLAEAIKRKPIIGWGIFAVVMVGVFALGILAASITERRAEIATLYNNKKVEITGINPHNEEWGINYPREYNTWKKTAIWISKASIWAICPKMCWSRVPKW